MIYGQILPVLCHKCKKIGTVEMVMGVPIPVRLLHTKLLHCQYCRAHYKWLSLLSGAAAAEARKQLEGTI